MTDQDYDLSFQESHYDWIRISQPELTLKPGESRTVSYALSPERSASPGGYYFTVFASANLDTGGVSSTIQAASLLYATVNGTLERSTKLDSVRMPLFLFSPDITYDFTMTDTGNVHSTIYADASLSNALETSRAETAAHVVLPDKPRRITGTLPAPKFPGVYTATVGYRTDDGVRKTVSQPAVYLPLWSIVLAIGALLAATAIIRRVRRHRRRITG